MEKVGIVISQWLLNRKKLLNNGVTIVIGPGHNGGDGAVIARELFLKGVSVNVWTPLPIKKKLTIKHLNYITSIGVEKLKKAPDPKINDLWIDAILGNNQKRGVNKDLISLFNEKFIQRFGKIISIDVPTGLCPKSGKPFDKNAIKANITLAVGLKKIGILQDTALPFVGKIHNINIGFTQEKLVNVPQKILSISYKDVKNLNLSLPSKNSTKYKRGRTLLIVGSEKYPGAAYLALQGAIASGAGIIKTMLPDVVANSIWRSAPEIIIQDTLCQSSEGNSLIYEALKRNNLNKFDSILIGPGIGVDVQDWEKSIGSLLGFKGLLILDADALNRIARSELRKEFFLERKNNTWITPHFNEFLRLFPHIEGINNVELAFNSAKNLDLKILLKGAHSVIADSKGKVWQLYGTNPCSARAGLGDLLSGFIAGMSAMEISAGTTISSESFAKYVLLHSFSASNCRRGSNASAIGNELSKITKKIKTRQMS
tara:strand:- start:2132 stop:3586 length:1455 start_codon:yes stop_codon:yes gene_type:complete